MKVRPSALYQRSPRFHARWDSANSASGSSRANGHTMPAHSQISSARATAGLQWKSGPFSTAWTGGSVLQSKSHSSWPASDSDSAPDGSAPDPGQLPGATLVSYGGDGHHDPPDRA